VAHVDAVNRQNQAAMRDNTECFVAVHEFGSGTKRACRRSPRMSSIRRIVLQNSFWITEDKFSGLWARPSNDRAGDHSNS
jgi:hypothetical protein